MSQKIRIKLKAYEHHALDKSTREITRTVKRTGARMVGLFGMGPVMDGMGIIHPVFSYSGLISISVTACRDMMPDPGFYSECLQASFDELLRAAQETRDTRD